jgi:hypothetical protein
MVRQNLTPFYERPKLPKAFGQLAALTTVDFWCTTPGGKACRHDKSIAKPQ